jgi:putative transposase
MPRIARVIAPEYPHHITQRGNNRATVFFDDEDRRVYLKLLIDYTQKYRVQVWAYCLMNNHIHLLAIPETETSLSCGIGLTNQMYTQYLNRKLKRSGRIWQNRFFSCIVENEQYLWAVARYIERNPLKAGVVANVEDYRWSSAKAHIRGTRDSLISAYSWFSPLQRDAFKEFLLQEDEETDSAIRRSTTSGRPFGSESFIEMLEFRLHQNLIARKPGRPKKTGECP